MSRYFAITLLVFAVAIGTVHAEEEHGYLFRGIVVPLSAGGETKAFAHSRLDLFTVRLHVSEIISGKGVLIQPNKDFIFGIHSIVLTFGSEFLKDVEGKEFIWLLTVTTLKNGVEVGRLERGEEFYESYKKESKRGEPGAPHL